MQHLHECYTAGGRRGGHVANILTPLRCTMCPDFFQQRREASSAGEQTRSCSKNQKEALPYLSRLLEGAAASKGFAGCPRYGLSLYASAQGVSWTLKEVNGPEVWYGPDVDHADPLTAIDQLLASGEARRGRDKPVYDKRGPNGVG